MRPPPARATTAHAEILSTHNELIQQLNYGDLIEFAHEVGNALVQESDPRKLARLREMYQSIANEHSLRLTGRPLR
jgi:NifB/MoaA-like Fe-S oxidoreductase